MSASPNSPWIQPERPLSHPAKPAKPPEAPPRWPIYCLLAMVVLAAAWVFRPLPRKSMTAPSVATFRATRGGIQNMRRVAGSITASRFVNICAPVWQAPDTGRGLPLIFLAASGTHVKEGQVIAEIDSQDIKDRLLDVEASRSEEHTS